MVYGTATDLQTLFMKRKDRIILIELLHSIERDCVWDVSIRVEPIDAKKLVVLLAPSCSRR